MGSCAVLGVVFFNLVVNTQESRGHTAAPWQLLSTIESVDTSDDIIPNLIKTFPEELRAASDNFEIEGYVMRFVSEPYLQEFMLLPDTPECAFCGGIGYGPFLEVRMETPLGDMPNYTKLRVRGQLELIEDPTVFDTARLVNATLVD